MTSGYKRGSFEFRIRNELAISKSWGYPLSSNRRLELLQSGIVA
jgi:hypothetical protein